MAAAVRADAGVPRGRSGRLVRAGRRAEEDQPGAGGPDRAAARAPRGRPRLSTPNPQRPDQNRRKPCNPTYRHTRARPIRLKEGMETRNTDSTSWVAALRAAL